MSDHTIAYRKKSDKVRKELEEAAREGGSRNSGGSDDKIMDSMPYYATALPSKVALRFVSSFSKASYPTQCGPFLTENCIKHKSS